MPRPFIEKFCHDELLDSYVDSKTKSQKISAKEMLINHNIHVQVIIIYKFIPILQQEKMAHRIWTMQEKFLNICKYGERSEMISKYW